MTHTTTIKDIYCFIAYILLLVNFLFYPDLELLPPINLHWSQAELGIWY